MMDQPTEILEMIYFHLDFKSKLQLALASPQLNKVLSNNSKMVNNVKVHWNGKSVDKWLLQANKSPVRPYQSLINTANQCRSGIVEFVKIHQNTLTSLEFSNCMLFWSEFYAMMECVSDKLQILHLENSNFVNVQELSPISMPNLHELTIRNRYKLDQTQVFKVIEAANIVKINYSDERDGKSHWIFSDRYNAGEVEACVDLVKRQKNLKWLSLPKQPSKRIVDDFACNPPTFQLESLVVPMFQVEVLDLFDRIPGPNLMAFLKTQKNTLRYLLMSDENVLDIEDVKTLLEVLKLKELRFYGDFLWFHEYPRLKNHTIERLEFGNCQVELFHENTNDNVICAILQSCHAVKTLCLNNVALTFNTSEAIRELKSLNKLELKNCDIMDLVDCTEIENVELTEYCRNCIIHMTKDSWHIQSTRSTVERPFQWRHIRNEGEEDDAER